MRTYNEIKVDLDAAKAIAKSLNLENIAPGEITDAHVPAARCLNAAIREYNTVWSKIGVVGPRSEWNKFSMDDMNGTEMSVWVFCS